MRTQVLILAFLLTSCTPYRVKPFKGHTGAADHMDSLAFDQITLAEALITQGRITLSTGDVEVFAAQIHALQDALNDAKTEWRAYREPIKLGAPKTPDRTKLNVALKKLKTQVETFRKERQMPN